MEQRFVGSLSVQYMITRGEDKGTRGTRELVLMIGQTTRVWRALYFPTASHFTYRKNQKQQ